MNGKIKIVVINENILGLIFPDESKYTYVSVLRASVLKGANGCDGERYMLRDDDKIRLANTKDFDDFYVYFSNSFKDETKYEYDSVKREYEYDFHFYHGQTGKGLHLKSKGETQEQAYERILQYNPEYIPAFMANEYEPFFNVTKQNTIS